MINNKIISQASKTNFYGLKKKYTHKYKMKNKNCGDIINLEVIIKNQKFKSMRYETESCIYCQASASFLSKYFINQNIKKVAETLNIINKYYEGQFILRNKGLIRIFNKDNFKRKECVYLPARAFFKALNLKKNINL